MARTTQPLTLGAVERGGTAGSWRRGPLRAVQADVPVADTCGAERDVQAAGTGKYLRGQVLGVELALQPDGLGDPVLRGGVGRIVVLDEHVPGPQDAGDGQHITGLQVTYGGAVRAGADVGGVGVRDNQRRTGEHAGHGVEEAVGEGGVGGVPDAAGRGVEGEADGGAVAAGFLGVRGGDGVDRQVSDLTAGSPSPSVAGWARAIMSAMPPAW